MLEALPVLAAPGDALALSAWLGSALTSAIVKETDIRAESWSHCSGWPRCRLAHAAPSRAEELGRDTRAWRRRPGVAYGERDSGDGAEVSGKVCWGPRWSPDRKPVNTRELA